MLFIRDVARACGVSPDTVRHYERKGVVPQAVRDRSGYRRYPPDTIERVRVIRRAIALGFTLDELARIYRQLASGRPPCREVRELARRKLADVEEQIAALVALRNALEATVAGWDDRLARSSASAFAELLTSLGDRQ
jgi:DNA-binding transcriptional MerR regulator